MQRHAIRLSVAAVTFLCGLAAQRLLGTYAYSGAEREVLAVESAYARAVLDKDVAALDSMLAEEFYVSGLRMRMSREHWLAFVGNPFMRVVSLEREDVRVRVRGDRARVTGRARLRVGRGGHEVESPRYKFRRHLVRRDGRWRIVRMEFSPDW